MRTKTADNSAAKKSEKGQDPAARVKTLMNLAFNLEVQQNYDGALEYYREVATKYPTHPGEKSSRPDQSPYREVTNRGMVGGWIEPRSGAL